MAPLLKLAATWFAALQRHNAEGRQPNSGWRGLCRLAKGKTVQEILDKVHKQALVRTGKKLDALKSWAWQFGIRVALFMFKVSPSAQPSATACQQPSALLVLPACTAATLQLARAEKPLNLLQICTSPL